MFNENTSLCINYILLYAKLIWNKSYFKMLLFFQIQESQIVKLCGSFYEVDNYTSEVLEMN